MKYVPKIHHSRAIEHVLDNYFCGLWMDMGLGKTAISLTVLRILQMVFGYTRILVVAPLRVCKGGTWQNEIEKWDHTQCLTYSTVLGTEAEMLAALKKPAYIYITNYARLKFLTKRYKKWPFQMLILDESSKIANPASVRFKQLRRKHVFEGTRRVIELSGAPVPNGLKGVWTQLYLMDRGKRLEPTFGQFKSRWFIASEYKITPYPFAQEQIENLVKDICLSMKKEDYIDLPDMIETTVPVPIQDEVLMQGYRKLEKQFFTKIKNENISAVNAGVLTGKLRQYANGVIYTDTIEGTPKESIHLHDYKVDALQDIVDEFSDQPIIVAYNYKTDLARIKARFPYAVHARDVDDLENTWNAGKIKMLLMYPGSDVHGLNLQVGGHIGVWFGPTWDMDATLQFNARLSRPGQTHTVYIYYLVAPGTIDTTIMARWRSKKTVLDSLMETCKARYGE